MIAAVVGVVILGGGALIGMCRLCYLCGVIEGLRQAQTSMETTFPAQEITRRQCSRCWKDAASCDCVGNRLRSGE